MGIGIERDRYLLLPTHTPYFLPLIETKERRIFGLVRGRGRGRE